LDCSLPMTFDTYNKCSYNCLYCFSYFQKSHSLGRGGVRSGKHNYQGVTTPTTWVNPEVIKRLFALDPKMSKSMQQFYPYIIKRNTMQWGGLADQFDEYERKHGITLELLKVFRSLKYPLCFSTKAVWWTKDKRYTDLFKKQDNWNTKFSIINLDKYMSRKIEKGVPSPQARLEAMKTVAGLNKGGVTLRLRPFIIGLSDKHDEYLKLIAEAKNHGATAVSTEFFCLELRADERLRGRYNEMSEAIGVDIFKYYRLNSKGSAGYLRLNRDIKRPYIVKMYNLCKALGLRFYVSDAHFKEYCHNGSCCGLPESFNYNRGQFTNALMIAKAKGEVRYSDIKTEVLELFDFPFIKAAGFNTSTTVNRARRDNQKMTDYVREAWNNPKSKKSPYKYFGGVLIPTGLDENKDVVYKYVGEKV